MITDLEFAKLYSDTQKKAIKKINRCYYPECEKKSINSHILQQNGILNQIAVDQHLWEIKIDHFGSDKFKFNKTGITKVFSFNCFCEEHDKKLFRKIEDSKIDFNDYESCLLFTIRTIYNEIWRKQVIIEQYKMMMKSEHSSDLNLGLLVELMQQQLLGLEDLKVNENDIWLDVNNGTRNFIFNYRELEKIDVCLSSFFNYETTAEMQSYYSKYGFDMERIAEIFVSIFPYNNKTLLLMGYNKKDESKVKAYFNTFFKESEKRVQVKITNMLFFTCENWVISENLYKAKIKKVEDIFLAGSSFGATTDNERKIFKINIFKDSFENDLKKIERHLL